MARMKIYVSDTVPGMLPRIPESEWESKRRPEQKFVCRVAELKVVNGKRVMVEKEPFETTMKAGLYLEDILVWCICKDGGVNGDYIEEEDGTHGVICARCGGVVHLG